MCHCHLMFVLPLLFILLAGFLPNTIILSARLYTTKASLPKTQPKDCNQSQHTVERYK